MLYAILAGFSLLVLYITEKTGSIALGIVLGLIVCFAAVILLSL